MRAANAQQTSQGYCKRRRRRKAKDSTAGEQNTKNQSAVATHTCALLNIKCRPNQSWFNSRQLPAKVFGERATIPVYQIIVRLYHRN